MNIQLHNTLSGKKEDFVGDKTVGMYHCGPTVYNYIHIGNLRAFFLADTLRRMFEATGHTVRQVMNVTDVGLLEGDNAEDKMTVALRREGKPLTLEAMRELADFYTQAFLADLESLNIQRPHVLPKASEHIPEDIAIIEKLEKKGLTYAIADGIYFDTSKIEDYGKLGGIGHAHADTEQSRIGMNADKRNPRDFALWKLNPSLGWESPWGKGFPGWHIECSAMSMRYLGETFDIHTGGIDLIPIHHNNEIAQSEHATGHTFARYWLHNAFVNVGEAKMAKSTGNYIALKTLTEKGYSPLDYRYLLLGARYSTPVNFSWEALEAAQNANRKLIAALQSYPDGGTVQEGVWNQALGFVADDLDTPKVLALVWDTLKNTDIAPADKKATALKIDSLLGLIKEESVIEDTMIPIDIIMLQKRRDMARANKDWKVSDELRDEMARKGYEVKDTAEGQKIRKI
ncbi:MAG: cysteine--tRNA ligase [Candidatus Paceibacterota bacterium]|jgi:cysteinyl-tRNA synthetase